MIRTLQVSNFRMLANNRVDLGPFHVLVGQNATGRSTFLGALQLVADVLALGVHQAVEKLLGSRTPDFRELCFDVSRPIAFALEVGIADGEHEQAHLRYELELGSRPGEGIRVLREYLFVLPTVERRDPQISLFGDENGLVIHDRHERGWRKVVQKTAEGKDYFRDEKTEWNNVFKFGEGKAALGSLPEDPDRFPQSIAVRDLLRDGVRTVALDAARLRSSSPPGGETKLRLDGSNLPDVVKALRDRDEPLFRRWVEHLSTAVPGLIDVDVRKRPEDKHLVLSARFGGMHESPVPSWLLSDGTLRLMALTLLSYAAQETSRDVYLVEEPENGLHPLAMQAAYDALSSPVGDIQILCATHSPVFLAQAKLEHALVFRRAPQGYAVVRRGNEVPELQEGSGRRNLAELFATGVLS